MSEETAAQATANDPDAGCVDGDDAAYDGLAADHIFTTDGQAEAAAGLEAVDSEGSPATVTPPPVIDL